MPGPPPRGVTGSLFTKGQQNFNVEIRGFKTMMLTMHRFQENVYDHFNADLKKMADLILKYALQNLMDKVYDPAGVKPGVGGYHSTKGYYVSGNLYKSGRVSEVSNELAAQQTASQLEGPGE